MLPDRPVRGMKRFGGPKTLGPFACAVVALLVVTVASPALAQTTGAAQTGSAWSPYLAGALIGVLSMFTFYFSDRPLGASSS